MKTLLLAALVGLATRADARPCAPAEPCWPDAAAWHELEGKLSGRLETPSPPPADLTDPFAIQEHAGGTQSRGWIGAWTAAPSAVAVVARGPADVAAAVDFAHRHGVKLVVKGTGHDYLGRSSAPDSLLVWTHELREVRVVEGFVPAGCATPPAPVAAVAVGAGARWSEVYEEVTTRHQRYVQGGGCTSVGAAGGFLQGGGFGSFSKKYGIAAGSLLEAEIVTADGVVRTANACQHADLLWALRGGGGGTFGVVTRVVFATHELPPWFGAAFGSVEAHDAAAYRALLRRFAAFYDQRLAGEHWGEKIVARSDNVLELSMVFQGLSQAEAEAVWRPFREWVAARRDAYTMTLRIAAWPADKMWDLAFWKQRAPEVVVPSGERWFWRGDGEQVGVTWVAYQSRWIPARLFRGGRFGDLLFAASRHHAVEIHFNKGQAGAAPAAVRRDRATAMNPAVLDAAALAIVATATSRDVDAARERVGAAMRILRAATPGSGSYVNETDYFEPDWQRSFWGANYPRLEAIKRKYDPDGVFSCHHCVGSE